MVDELCPFVKMRSINMEIYKEALILKLISYKEEGKLILTNMVGQLKNVMSCIVVCVYI